MKPASTVTSLLLGVIALGHLMRIVMGSAVTINERIIPMWPSFVTVVVMGTLAVLVWREARQP